MERPGASEPAPRSTAPRAPATQGGLEIELDIAGLRVGNATEDRNGDCGGGDLPQRDNAAVQSDTGLPQDLAFVCQRHADLDSFDRHGANGNIPHAGTTV